MNIKQRQEKIIAIKNSIIEELSHDPGINIEQARTGRNGTRLFVNIPKKGVSSLEIIVDSNLVASMGIAVDGRDGGESSQLIKSIMKQGGYNLIKDQTNPRYSYTLESFLNTYSFLKSHLELEDVECTRISKKLFDYTYSPMKIVQRYQFAISNEDQIMLDLCRNLLDADRYDDDIRLNKPASERSYREHVVPCVMIHNQIIELFLKNENIDLKEIEDLIKQNLRIAYITPEEAHKLDYEYNLRTTMPAGWCWGDDILSRLNHANISIQNSNH